MPIPRIYAYVTDSSDNIIPFMKNGDEVILTPLNQGLANDTQPDTPWSSTVSFPNGAAYPNVQELSFPGAPIPLSASAIIVDFIMYNTDSSWHQTRVLNPTVITDYTASCSAYPQLFMAADKEAAAGLPTLAPYSHVRIKSAINTNIPGGTPGTPAEPLTSIQVAGCTAPSVGETYYVQAAYVGYVEQTHHLGF